MSGISVVAVALQSAPHAELIAGRPSHDANDAAICFTNPWPSFRDARWTDWLRAIRSWKTPPVPTNVIELIRFKPPAWNDLNDEPEKAEGDVVGFPTPPGAARGPRILFDPVFSHQCGPTSRVGPGRITPPACPVQQLPEVDAIVISHCHYNHLDIPTIKSVVFPLQTHLLSIFSGNYHCLDWWHNHDVTVQLPAAPSTSESSQPSLPPIQRSSQHPVCIAPPLNAGVIATSSTDGQHYGARGPSNPIFSTQRPRSQRTDPWRIKGSSSAATPGIGACVMARMRMNCLTWVLSSESVLEPVRELKVECAKAGIEDWKFTTCGLGDTTVV
ncbi:hypothetical protein M422DRAFT_257608 [Sphaerobolus stellatus SS14]|uniref:Metallo-beta-lactamase domain-containing protein n=1 Tax=Sphaerobolus stellatus (strain SS14) TaxID=990650 RepID=A0A0C9U907_SPHS4|nr:hypothetical protein M422DRAFT_257608 [Sphaerobolus stellatus SS14]